MSRAAVRVFQFVEELDAFVPDATYVAVAEDLGIVEWNPVVWIGRFFLLDNDFGEHWFDDHALKDARADEAARLGIDADDLLVLRPELFQDGRDGPQHTDQARKRFWTDVLCSLELSLETLADEARLINSINRERFSKDYLHDLDARLERWRVKLLHHRQE